MKNKSNNDNNYGTTNHDSADTNTDANTDTNAVFPFSISNILPSSRMNMILSTIVPLQRSSSTTSTASLSSSTSTSTSNDDASTSITSNSNSNSNRSFMNGSNFGVADSSNRKEPKILLLSSSVPVATAAAHSSSTSSSLPSSSVNNVVTKSNDWTNINIHPTEYIKSLFRSKTEYGGNDDTNNVVDDVDNYCS